MTFYILRMVRGLMRRCRDGRDTASREPRLRFEPLEPRTLLSVNVTVNYDFDANGFFADQSRRDVFEAAVDEVARHFLDDLDAIVPGGSNSWSQRFFDPATGNLISVNNPTVAADEVIIYTGGRELGSTLGVGGPGGFSASGNQAFFNTIRGRGEAGALLATPADFGLWGGSIAFDLTTNWHFGVTTDGLDFGEFDFYSVAIHEALHLFGFGTADSFDALNVGGLYTGAVSTAVFDGVGSPPLRFDGAHWQEGLQDDGQETAMDPNIANNTRKLPTPLDWAAMDDMGWDLIGPPPTAVNDAYNVDEDDTLVVNAATGVLANDTDPDTPANELTAALIDNAQDGTVSLNADGSFTYTPDPDFFGTDSFTYHANDGTSDSNTATVIVIVNPGNDSPVATSDAYMANEDTPLNIAAGAGVLINDADPVEGDGLTAMLVSDVSHGSLSLDADGSFGYTPDADFFGTDTFTYVANDGVDDSNTATVTINVAPVNDAPITVTDHYETFEEVPLTVGTLQGLLGNDSDIDSASLTVFLVDAPDDGVVQLSANGSFTYTPNVDFFGLEFFTYIATDGMLMSPETTVSIKVNLVNDAPVAANDMYTALEDTPKVTAAAQGVLANDTDVEGTPLTAALVTGPANGQVTLNSDGGIAYTPNANFNGIDTFTYRANDGVDDSNTATVTINVMPVNDPPVAVNDSYYATEDTPLVITEKDDGVLGNDSDPVEGDDKFAFVVDLPTHGGLAFELDGVFTYTPDPNYHGVDSFTYRSNDGDLSNLATATINVAPVNDAPDTTPDMYSVDEDDALVVNAAMGVLANDTDVEGDNISATLVTQAANGTVSLNPNGGFTYLPTQNFEGADTFTYRAADDDGAMSAPTTVTINVNPINDAPTAIEDEYVSFMNTPLIISAMNGVLGNDSDPVEGDPLNAILDTTTDLGTLTLNSDGSFNFVPDMDVEGFDTFTYFANDGTDNSAPVTVVVWILPPNDPPTANDDGYAVDEDTPLVVDTVGDGVLDNDVDPDMDALATELISTTQNGALSMNDDGTFTYTPDADFFGTDEFTYRAADRLFTSNTATVTITVNAVDDPPVATDDAYTTPVSATLNVPAAGGVLVNDSDIDSALDAVLITGPSNGSLALNADGSFTYTPDAGFMGTDTFEYAADDGTSATEAIASIEVSGNLDADGDGDALPLTDGLLILRYLVGFRGAQLTENVVGAGATRTTSEQIVAYLQDIEPVILDADGSGEVTALTDGVLILRFLTNFQGDQLVNGAIGPGATRTTGADIIAFLTPFLPVDAPGIQPEYTYESESAEGVTEDAPLTIDFSNDERVDVLRLHARPFASAEKGTTRDASSTPIDIDSVLVRII